MRFAGIGYRRRKHLRDGKNVDVFVNQDLGLPSFSVRFRDRVTINPTARRGNRVTMRIRPGWTWKL
jgi:hypothetical protein